MHPDNLSPDDIPIARQADGDGWPAEAVILDNASGTPPRLGIIHFLAWITLSAVLFGVTGFIRLFEDPSRELHNVVYHSFELADMAVISASLVGFVALVRWRRSENPLPMSPGHWILATGVIPAVLIFCVTTVRRVLEAIAKPVDPLNSYRVYSAIYMLVVLAQATALVLVAAKVRERANWTVAFALLSAVCGTSALLHLLFLMPWSWRLSSNYEWVYPAVAISHFVVAIAVAAIAAVDLRTMRRDWIHGLGILFVFFGGVMWMGYWIAEKLLR